MDLVACPHYNKSRSSAVPDPAFFVPYTHEGRMWERGGWRPRSPMTERENLVIGKEQPAASLTTARPSSSRSVLSLGLDSSLDRTRLGSS